MSKGARLAIIAGIVVAIAVGATIVTVSVTESSGSPPGGNNKDTAGQPRQIEVNLNENLTVKAK